MKYEIKDEAHVVVTLESFRLLCERLVAAERAAEQEREKGDGEKAPGSASCCVDPLDTSRLSELDLRKLQLAEVRAMLRLAIDAPHETVVRTLYGLGITDRRVDPLKVPARYRTSVWHRGGTAAVYGNSPAEAREALSRFLEWTGMDVVSAKKG